MFRPLDRSFPASARTMIDDIEDVYRRLEEEEIARRSEEAALPDSHFDAVPVPARFEATGLVRHAELRTGLPLERIELICLQSSPPGTLARLAAGDPDPELPRVNSREMAALRHFVNISRAVEATSSRAELDWWWKTRRHGKRYSPERALAEGVLGGTSKVFDAYEEELVEGPPSVLYVFDAHFVEVPHQIPGFTIPR